MMQYLKDLIALGFSPALAMTIVVVIVLWGSLCAVVVVFYRSNNQARTETRARIAEAESRLEESDRKHQVCDADRHKMKRQIGGMQVQIRMIRACDKMEECPMKKIFEEMAKGD